MSKSYKINKTMPVVSTRLRVVEIRKLDKLAKRKGVSRFALIGQVLRRLIGVTKAA
jgi:hypothetical protein